MKGDRVFFRSKGIVIEVGKGIASFAGKPVTIGVRPEDISIEYKGQGGLDGRVEIVENAGSERLIHLTIGESRMVVRTAPSAQWKEDDRVSLRINIRKIHLFYQGDRIDIGF